MIMKDFIQQNKELNTKKRFFALKASRTGVIAMYRICVYIYIWREVEMREYCTIVKKYLTELFVILKFYLLSYF